MYMYMYTHDAISAPPSSPFADSPVKFIGGSPLRYMYCVIMSCWGADVVQDLLDTSLYYRSSNGLLDALTVFGMST